MEGRLFLITKKTQWMYIWIEFISLGRETMIRIKISDQKVLFQNINIKIEIYKIKVKIKMTHRCNYIKNKNF